MKRLLILTLMALNAGASELPVEADILIHAQDAASAFAPRLRLIQVTPAAQLPNMQFNEPYQADWLEIRATRMSGLDLKSQPLPNGELLVDLTWVNPGILINDLRTGGAITGRCFGVNWRLPEGTWRARGRLTYNFAAQKVEWSSFQFENIATGPAFVNLGDCDMTGEQIDLLQSHMAGLSTDDAWTRDLVRDTVVHWAEAQIEESAGALMSEQEIDLNPSLKLAWRPTELRMLEHGGLRVRGEFVFKAPRSSYQHEPVRRTEAEDELNRAQASAVILPRNAIEQVVLFTSRAKALYGTVDGRDIPAFVKVISSRRQQHWTWEDLKNFPLNHPFLFQMATAASAYMYDPAGGTDGDLNFGVKVFLAIHSLAKVSERYVPYFDFRSTEFGSTQLRVAGGRLLVKLHFPELHTRPYVRDEFRLIRGRILDFVNADYINTGAKEFLDMWTFSTPLIGFPAGEGRAFTPDGLKLEPGSLRLPLALQ